MQQEIWKDISGYENKYQVSDSGKIKSLSRKYIMPNGYLAVTKEKILIPSQNNKGYLLVWLRNGVRKNAYTLHRLVALHHVPNPNKLPEVNHSDGDKKNCAASNLAWITRIGNCKHAVSMGLTKSKGDNYRAKIVLNLQTGIYYDCVGDAADSIGTTRTKLTCRLNGKSKNNTSFIYA